jgi:hypothetical protein
VHITALSRSRVKFDVNTKWTIDLKTRGGGKLILSVHIVIQISTGIATDYGLDEPAIEARGGRHFPPQPPVQWVPGLSRG